MAKDAAKGSWTDWLVDRLLRAIIKGALMLPLRLRSWLVGKFVAYGLAPLVGYYRRALNNLEYVWPDMPEPERRRIARAVCDNAGRTMIELFDGPGLQERMSKVPLKGEGVAAIEKAKAEGRPILLITGHYGNFEAPQIALVSRGYDDIGGLFRPMSNPYFNEFYTDNLGKLPGPDFAQGRRGTTALLRHIKAGGMSILLFDIFVSGMEPVEFLGKPAPTSFSAAEIALKTGALLVPYFGIRQPDGVSFEAVFEAPIEHTDAKTMMEEATRRLEARIKAKPEQWLWIHRRWSKSL